MATDAISDLLEQAFPDAEVAVVDRTGGGDHFHVTVVASRAFDGLTLVEQHRLVNRAVADRIADGTIHELRITNEGNDMTETELRDQIQHVIDTEPVAVFMKGTPDRPPAGTRSGAAGAVAGRCADHGRRRAPRSDGSGRSSRRSATGRRSRRCSSRAS